MHDNESTDVDAERRSRLGDARSAVLAAVTSHPGESGQAILCNKALLLVEQAITLPAPS